MGVTTRRLIFRVQARLFRTTATNCNLVIPAARAERVFREVKTEQIVHWDFRDMKNCRFQQLLQEFPT